MKPPHLLSELRPEGQLRSDLVKGALAALAVTGGLLLVNWHIAPRAALFPAALPRAVGGNMSGGARARKP